MADYDDCCCVAATRLRYEIEIEPRSTYRKIEKEDRYVNNHMLGNGNRKYLSLAPNTYRVRRLDARPRTRARSVLSRRGGGIGCFVVCLCVCVEENVCGREAKERRREVSICVNVVVKRFVSLKENVAKRTNRTTFTYRTRWTKER